VSTEVQDKHAQLVADMRQAADALERISELYVERYADFHKWSAKSLRAEADYLERHP
jgi:Na+/phosphate symporter